MTGANNKVVAHRALRIRTAKVSKTSVDTFLDSVLIQSTDFSAFTIVVSATLVLWWAAAKQVVGVSGESFFARASGLVISGHTLSVRATTDSSTGGDAVQNTLSIDGTDFVVATFGVCLAQVGGTSSVRIARKSSVAGKAFASWSVVSSSAESTGSATLPVADIDTVSNAFVGQHASFFALAVRVVFAQMFRWLLTSVERVPNKARKTFANRFVIFTHAVSVRPTTDVIANFGTISEARFLPSTCLKVGARRVVRTSGDRWLTSNSVVVSVTLEV